MSLQSPGTGNGAEPDEDGRQTDAGSRLQVSQEDPNRAKMRGPGYDNEDFATRSISISAACGHKRARPLRLSTDGQTRTFTCARTPKVGGKAPSNKVSSVVLALHFSLVCPDHAQWFEKQSVHGIVKLGVEFRVSTAANHILRAAVSQSKIFFPLQQHAREDRQHSGLEG